MRLQIVIPFGSDIYNLFHSADLLFKQLQTEGYFAVHSPGTDFRNVFDASNYKAISAAFTANEIHERIALSPADIQMFLAVISQVCISLISTKVNNGEFVNWIPHLIEIERRNFIDNANSAMQQLNTNMSVLVKNVAQAELA